MYRQSTSGTWSHFFFFFFLSKTNNMDVWYIKDEVNIQFKNSNPSNWNVILQFHIETLHFESTVKKLSWTKLSLSRSFMWHTIIIYIHICFVKIFALTASWTHCLNTNSVCKGWNHLSICCRTLQYRRQKEHFRTQDKYICV